jgi:hypothetical protein
MAESGPDIEPISKELDVRFREKQTFSSGPAISNLEAPASYK